MNNQAVAPSRTDQSPATGAPTGHKTPARVPALLPGSIAEIRARLGFSQKRFAQACGISIDTLQTWEQGRRQPTGPAKVLLRIAARDPAAMLKAVA